jgi:muconolactone D-isomerase
VEFLVRIEIRWPPDKPVAERDEIFERELQAGQALARAGLLRRLWRIPGRWANWSLYDVEDATALHSALTTLPLHPWMDIEVHPLAEHPNDPRLLGIDAPDAPDEEDRP